MTFAPKTIVFRADASPELGLGHVLRCRSLALALRSRGHVSHFACAEIPEFLLAELFADKFTVHGLDPAAGKDREADDMQQLIEKIGAEVIILDHYQRNADWTRAVGSDAKHVVIDDLADREHDCALLVDQNLGRTALDYDGLVPQSAARLIGLRFALLRPEFLARRTDSLTRRADVVFPQNILVSMGGQDMADATSATLRALKVQDMLPRDLRIRVVMGPNAPHLEAVRTLARTMPFDTSVLVGVHNMEDIMCASDLAVGAAGGTAWERCVLGLPTLVSAVAQNQKLGAANLAASGAALSLPDLSAQSFSTAFSDILSKPEKLRILSDTAAALCDGRGATRVAAAIDALFLTVRHATMEDANHVYQWRNAGETNRYFETPGKPSWEDHCVWMEQAFADPDRALFMVELEGTPVCHVRMDADAHQPDRRIVSIVASPGIRGKGLAIACLQCAMAPHRTQSAHRFLARVHRENTASGKLFLAAGFSRGGTDGVFETYLLDLTATSNK